MIGIFQGRGIADRARVHAQIDVDFREHIRVFNNGKNLNPLGVFLCIALHAGEGGWAWPGRELLKKETGISTESALTSALAHLRSTRLGEQRAFAHFRVLDPDKKRWGRSAYLIFPDLPAGPPPFAHLVEFTNKSDPIYDDPTLGHPTLGDHTLEEEPSEVEPYKVTPTPSARVTEPEVEEPVYSPGDEPRLVPVEGPEDAGDERETLRQKSNVPETKFQRGFLAVCGAKHFKPRQKTKVKLLAKCLDIGAGFQLEADAYRRCLEELKNCTEFPDRPIAVPLSWYEWRAKHASEHRWSVTGFISALFDRDALVRHCQVKLKGLGITEETKERQPPSGPVYY